MMINHIMCILKNLTHLCFIKQKTKIKNGSVKVAYNVVVLIKHKEDCLSINGQQSINLKKGTIKFKSYFKQLPVPFEIFAYFGCNLKNVECYDGACSKKYHEHVPCSYAYKVVCIDDKYSKSSVVYRSENAAYKFIKAKRKERKYCKNIMKDELNKNLIMTEE